MIKLQILNNPRQGSCILGLLTSPDATGKMVSTLSDYKGLTILVDSMNYISFTSEDEIKVTRSTQAIYEQSLPVEFSSEYYVNTPLVNDTFTLSNRSLCNTNSNFEALAYYEFDPFPYLWISDQTGEDYSTLLSVGLEIYNNIKFYTTDSQAAFIMYDISLPEKEYKSKPLYGGLYHFKIYTSSIPEEPILVGFDCYNISTGKVDYVEQPLNLKKIFDRTETRDLLSIETHSIEEYQVPYSSEIDQFGSDLGDNRMKVING